MANSKPIQRSNAAANAGAGVGIVMCLIGGFLTFVGAVGGGSSFGTEHELLSKLSGGAWVAIALVGLALLFFGSNLASKK